MGWFNASRSGRLSVCLAVTLILVASHVASAAPVLNFDIVRGDGVEWHSTTTGSDASPIVPFDYNVNSTNWQFQWNGSADVDPIINSNFTIQNNTGSTQTYSVTVLSPIVPPIAGATTTGGSVGGSVTDGNGGGATVAAPAGGSIYTSIIDGVDFQKLHLAPFSQAAGNLSSSNVPVADFGQPIPNFPGPAALTNIGIRLNFTLTAGDSASFTSNFVVVPEPATLSVLGLAGVALLARRRRV